MAMNPAFPETDGLLYEVQVWNADKSEPEKGWLTTGRALAPSVDQAHAHLAAIPEDDDLRIVTVGRSEGGYFGPQPWEKP